MKRDWSNHNNQSDKDLSVKQSLVVKLDSESKSFWLQELKHESR